MEKKYFMLHLIPARPDFAETMSESERNIMLQHVEYWKELLYKKIAVVFGPVFDPKGSYGAGVIAVDSDEEVQLLIENDPATSINRYEYYPMRAIVLNDN